MPDHNGCRESFISEYMMMSVQLRPQIVFYSGTVVLSSYYEFIFIHKTYVQF